MMEYGYLESLTRKEVAMHSLSRKIRPKDDIEDGGHHRTLDQLIDKIEVT